MTEPAVIIDALAEALTPRVIRILFPNGLPQQIEKPMSLNELADFTGVSRSTLAEMAKQRRIPHHRAGKRMIFLASEVLESLRVSVEQKGGTA
jgi:excisionase family DNA binding protein